jgi:hypothetical protein
LSLESKVRFQEYLSQIPIELAQTITLKNNLACNLYSKARLIELLSVKFRDKKFLADLFNKLTEAQCTGLMLVLFYKDEDGIPIPECHSLLTELFPGTKDNAEELMNSLVEYGLVLVLPSKRKTYSISMDLRDSLIEIIAQKVVKELEVWPGEPHTVRSDHLTLVRDIFTFLAFLKKDQVKLTQENLIFKRTQLRIFDTFELPEQPVEDDEKSTKGGYPERFDFIYKFCIERQFIQITGNHLTLTGKVTNWLAKSDFEKVKEIFKFWQQAYLSSSSEAYLILKLLHLAPSNTWISQTSLKRVLDLRIPKGFSLKSSAEARSDYFLSLLLYMGCIEQGIIQKSTENLVGIRLSPLGYAVLMNDESLFPYRSEKTFSVQPNFEIIASKNLDLSIRWYLTRITELVRVADTLTYKLSRHAIYKTLQEGETADKILEFLWKYSEKPLPEKVHQTVLDWTSTYGRIGFVDAFLLRCDNEALAKELKESKRIHKFIVDEISPTYLVVRRRDYFKLLEALEEENYMPRPGVERLSR